MSQSPSPPVPQSPSPSVLILGGGFAGLAAAVELAERGIKVLLLERRAFLGGRAYSFTDKTTGDTVDNGQHLMMGCYHHTIRFLKKIGAFHKLKFQANPQVDFLSEENKTVSRASFKCPSWPAPLHLLAGLAKLETLNWRDRLHALRIGLELRTLNGNRERLSDITVRDWLNQLGQTETMQRRFWDLVAIATLNETPDRASADMFARVLDQAFMHTRQDSTMVISKTGLSELYTEDARKFIEDRGGEVRLNADVARIEFENQRARRVVLRSGEVIEAGTIISAVPYFALRRMIAEDVLATSHSLRCLTELNSAPIVSINLWYAEPVTELEFTGLLDSRIEWVFNKNAIAGNAGSKPQHLALVISGAHELAKLPKEELIALAVAEMNRFFPLARTQQPFHAFVAREQDATMSHTVGVARLRPTYRTEFENFFLAGDWTATGLPATIESAVQSGHECAQLVAERTT
ncbi:MAG TPA: hydroxysqualene dehydroxylase HpnE [Blastocatellia bacterium]|nr:hydroxysqualene dehydroxylase HpnE [Blastocatellia bacterium]HMY75694.1 hydroxysqualene dehydroxylase HpnE [Blastocatellia bacterium]HMZ20912.1 hydroxysqualene dehydroxylase HpnE [Blastocatellia bacterium]